MGNRSRCRFMQPTIPRGCDTASDNQRSVARTGSGAHRRVVRLGVEWHVLKVPSPADGAHGRCAVGFEAAESFAEAAAADLAITVASSRSAAVS